MAPYAEIARRLFVSRYTVETHLKHVFGKQGSLLASRSRRLCRDEITIGAIGLSRTTASVPIWESWAETRFTVSRRKANSNGKHRK